MLSRNVLFYIALGEKEEPLETSNLTKEVSRLIRESGLSDTDLHYKTSLSRSTIYRLRSGEAQRVQLGSVKKIASACGYYPKFYEDGSFEFIPKVGEPGPQGATYHLEETRELKDVPGFIWSEMKKKTIIDPSGLLVAEPGFYATRENSMLDRYIYSILVDKLDGPMGCVEAGDLIFCSPNSSPSPGDRVLLCTKSKDYAVGILGMDGKNVVLTRGRKPGSPIVVKAPWDSVLFYHKIISIHFTSGEIRFV